MTINQAPLKKTKKKSCFIPQNGGLNVVLVGIQEENLLLQFGLEEEDSREGAIRRSLSMEEGNKIAIMHVMRDRISGEYPGSNCRDNKMLHLSLVFTC